MRIILLFPVLLFLAACDGASPAFRDAHKVTTVVEGSRFTLRVRDNMVEAIRTSPEMLPRYDEVARKAAFAAERETGCKVAWAEGDPAMLLMGMSCNGAPPPPKPRRREMLFCDIVDGTGGTSFACELS